VRVEAALNVGLSTLATEHFFTAFLSSPKASEQFLKPEDVRQMFMWATAVSLGFAAIMSVVLQNAYGVLSALALTFIFYLAYSKAMETK
jgi:hypothetical protein